LDFSAASSVSQAIIVVYTLTLATIPFAFLLKDPRRTDSV